MWCPQGGREVVPQGGGSRAKGPVTHSAEVGLGGFEEVGVGRAEVASGVLQGNQFFKVGGGVSMNALVC